MIWLFHVNNPFGETELLAHLAPPTMVVMAYLMLGKVRYFSFKQINLAGRQPFEFLVTFIVVALLLYMLKQHFDIVLTVGAWSYVLVCPGMALARSLRRASPAQSDSDRPASLGPTEAKPSQPRD